MSTTTVEEITARQLHQIQKIILDCKLSKDNAQKNLIESGALSLVLRADLSFPDIRERLMFALGMRPYVLKSFISIDGIDRFRTFSQHIAFANSRNRDLSLPDDFFGAHFLPGYDFPVISGPSKADYVLASIDFSGDKNNKLSWEWMLRFWNEDGLVPADCHDLFALACKYREEYKSNEKVLQYQNVGGLSICYYSIVAPGAVAHGFQDRFAPKKYPNILSLTASKEYQRIFFGLSEAPLSRPMGGNEKYFLLRKKELIK